VCFFALNIENEIDALDLEKKLIREARVQGMDILNISNGGGYASQSRTEDQILKLREKVGRKVYCYQTAKVYNSLAEASEELKVENSHISSCCRKITLQAKGYEFDYLENVKDFTKREVAVNTRKAVKIICEQDGKVYKSIYEAVKMTGVESSHINRILKGELNSSKGYSFKRYEEGKVYNFKPRVLKRRIKCINNGVVYKTNTELAKSLKMDVRGAIAVCNGERRTSKGLKFEYTYKYEE